uniref:Protein WEAK CHLOROPLAST MOVEMENT UNDER BLUE LIGHT 1 n=1 Tax=Leersia perrieri TaxID=77586 RepID=A0A0D9VNH2_9ORYZ
MKQLTRIYKQEQLCLISVSKHVAFRYIFCLLHLCCGMDEAPAPLGSSTSHQESDGDQCQQQADRRHPSDASNGSSNIQPVDGNAAHIDTTAPIDSVKGAVSKFGGKLDWGERRKQVQDELDKVQEEMVEFQKRSQEAEAGMAQAVKELGGANGEISDLRLSLETAQAEEARARQDAELAELRLRGGESTAAKAELAVARERHATAVADLTTARSELDSLRKEHAAAVADADAAAARARGTASSSSEAVNAVEELAAELAVLKEELDASHVAHDEAEEKRIRLGMAFEKEKIQWREELERAEIEAKKLAESVMEKRDLESKVAAASDLLVGLRAELFAVAVEGTIGDEEATVSSRAKLEKTRKDLEEVKSNVDKVNEEAKCLRVAAASLGVDLEKNRSELAALRRRESATSSTIPSLEEELIRVTAALTAARANGGGATTTAAQLDAARREAAKAKGDATSAQEEVSKAREEAILANAAVHAMEARLEALARETLAATTSEGIAAASAAALAATTTIKTQDGDDKAVTLTAEEYEDLSRRARETEEIAGNRVTEAVKMIKEAKEAEVRSIEKLAQMAKQTEQRRQALIAASSEAEEAEFGKLAAERELRQWRAEHEHQRRLAGATASPRTGLAEISVFDDVSAGGGGGNPHILSPRGGYMPRNEMTAAGEGEGGAKQRPTFFPRMVMFLARKRAQNWK